MTTRPALTIGIPTYNFGGVIGETLASVTASLPDDVEILIVDGGSRDATGAIIESWAKRFPSIRYHRKETRDGIDIDMALVVELAQGDYCWLLSADDLIEPGAIATVLSYIGERCEGGRPDVILLSHSNCDATMRTIQPRHPVLAGPTRMIPIADTSSRHRYFADALTTEALFSFISGLVVRRAAWDVTRSTADLFYGSCWAHAARLLSRMRDVGLDIVYVRDPLVRRRGENDSFAERGVIARYALGIDGYTMLVGTLFGRESIEYAHTLHLLRREFTLVMFMYAKLASSLRPERESSAELARLFDTIYPRTARFALHRLAFRLPAPAFVSMFEAANTVRHRALGRAA